jgi:hypothetical protein
MNNRVTKKHLRNRLPFPPSFSTLSFLLSSFFLRPPKEKRKEKKIERTKKKLGKRLGLRWGRKWWIMREISGR